MVEDKKKYKYDTEASWSDSRNELLCLHTGDWRTERPIVDKEKCNICAICVMYCPPQCMVEEEDGEYYEADLDYCKGCGICAVECPKKAITMTPEGEYADDCPID